jgi:hypothetical protein
VPLAAQHLRSEGGAKRAHTQCQQSRCRCLRAGAGAAHDSL